MCGNTKKIGHILIAILLTALCSFTALAHPGDTIGFSSEQEQFEYTIELIEQDLIEKGSSVESQLTSLIAEYETQQTVASSTEDIEKLQQLICTTQNLLSGYQNYANPNILRSFHPVHSPVVAAVVSWFNSNGYFMSAELLLHAESNTVLDSAYTPVNYTTSVLLNTSVVTQIRQSSQTSGSGEFTLNPIPDFYYAIHYFNWTKVTNTNPKVLTISDRYDFQPGDYSGIAGAAINAMYLAQTEGYLTPFYTTIISAYH
jgi:hypothetical protein